MHINYNNAYPYQSSSFSPYQYQPSRNQDERFLGPFLLGGLVGGLAAAPFYRPFYRPFFPAPFPYGGPFYY